MNFLFVYIREAHPRPARTIWGTRVVPKRLYGNGAVSEPRNATERRAVAQLCVTTLGLTMLTVIDDSDNSVARAYRGWPERLFLIDRLGRVRFATAPGPAGFSPQDLESAIKEHLARDVTSGEGRE